MDSTFTGEEESDKRGVCVWEGRGATVALFLFLKSKVLIKCNII